MVKILKKFSILRKIWSFFNLILVSIFGLSFTDYFEIDIFSRIFLNLSEFFSNSINFIRSSRFYRNILELFSRKIEVPVEFPSKMGSMNRNDSSSTTIKESIERFNQIIYKEEIKPEDTSIFTNKYFIWGSFLLISGVAYYYFGDEIKVYSISLWNFLRGRNPGDGGNNPPNSPTNSFNTMINYLGLNQNTNNEGILNQIIDSDGSEAIEIIDETKVRKLEKAVSFIDKSKSSILTSPSLENLNSNVEEGWSHSRPTSPESIASTSTIRQRIAPKIKIDTDVSSSHLSPSDSSIQTQLSPNSSIDEALTPNETNIKPFVTIETIDGKVIHNYNEESFKLLTNKGILDRMNWIESKLADGNIENLDKETLNKLHDKVCDVALSYNSYVKDFNKVGMIKNDLNQPPIKYFGFLMRDWLNKHLQLIWPEENINIQLGNKFDKPLKINEDIFNIDDHQVDDSDSE
jgi:hypothetical protein